MSYRKSRNLPRVLIAVAVLAIAAFALMTTRNTVSGAATIAPVTGAIFTTDAACTGTDLNIYGNKNDVYIDGGPQKQSGAAGLPDGDYYVKVTEPDGTLLGTSVGSGTPTPVHVTGGEFDACYQLSVILIKASDSTPGYDDTSNGGGEYKVWVSTISTFDNDQTKTDNFKVKSVECPEPPCGPPPAGTITVIKFYDANTNGIADPQEVELQGWKVFIEPGVITGPYFTTAVVQSDPGDYIVSECSPSQTNWFHTTPAIVNPVTVVDLQNTTVKFGNICRGGGGGLTLGFWSNKNGGNTITSKGLLPGVLALCLRKADGGLLGIVTLGNFQKFLLTADAVNMANMLSAQLAAMYLNVASGGVNGNSLIYAPGTNSANANGYATVNAVIAEASALLCTGGATKLVILTGNPNRARAEALKTALDQANNNLNFVQPDASNCPYTNFVCPND
jgi:hypothetical protein